MLTLFKYVGKVPCNYLFDMNLDKLKLEHILVLQQSTLAYQINM